MKKFGIIICLLCLNFTTVNVYASDDETYEILYNIEDQRYDYGSEDNRHIQLGVFKQWLAALLLMENTRDFDKELTILQDSPREQMIFPPFFPGDKVKLNEILSALLITPADGVYLSTAIYIGQSEEDFLKLMDTLCTKIGMTNTDVYSDTTTTHDLVMLLSYCWHIEEIQDIMKQPRMNTSFQIPLINPFRKTNDAEEIQYIFQSDDMTIAIINMKDTSLLVVDDSLNNINQIIEDCKQKYQKQVVIPQGQEIGNITFDTLLFPVSYTIYSEEECVTIPYTIDNETIQYEFYAQEKLQLPIFKGAKLGSLQIKDKDHIVKVIPIYSDKLIISYPKYIVMFVIVLSIAMFEMYRKKKKSCQKK